MMNKALALVAAILFGAIASPQGRVFVPRRKVRVYVNGQLVRFDGVEPIRVGRRILVPMRGVFEKMGANVTYDARRHRVLASKGKTRVVLPLTGSNRRAFVNGRPRRLDAYPKISDGHVLVPIRFVAETLDASVAYSAPDSTVRITPH